jgi:O-antigen ligase
MSHFGFVITEISLDILGGFALVSVLFLFFLLIRNVFCTYAVYYYIILFPLLTQEDHRATASLVPLILTTLESLRTLITDSHIDLYYPLRTLRNTRYSSP